MVLSGLDWSIILFFIGLTLFIGLYFAKQAGKSLTDFFLGGRKLPWYVAGVSMVATTFAADTPLAVTEIVAKNGISGNWLWWNMLIGGMLTTFFFARYWRRANILTEVEFITLRYGGKPAKFLRLFKSLYLGLIMNSAVMAWVNIAFISILTVFFGLDPKSALWIVFGICLFIGIYSSMSGLWGVAINDMIQFGIAMTGSLALAYFVISSDKIGGISGLKAALPESSFQFFPSIDTVNTGTLSVGLASFLAFIGFQWWSSWYPGGEPGGGGYIAQRMMSVRSEKDSVLATLFFQFAHYCLRPWPWILVGLATMVLYPELSDDDKKLGYVMAMRDYLPNGWRGLMIAAFGAAYMSTMSTQLNWGAGYLTNDFVLPLNPQLADDQKKLVLISRISTIMLCITGCLVTTQFTTIKGVWSFILECGAGLGLVLILRWYWWRISAVSEIVATIAPFIGYSLCKLVFSQYDEKWEKGIFENPSTFFFTLGFTSIVWIIATFISKPESKDTLDKFYSRVRPAGIWPQSSQGANKSLLLLVILWIASVVAIYTALFTVGSIILQNWDDCFFYSAFMIPSVIITVYLFQQHYTKSEWADPTND